MTLVWKSGYSFDSDASTYIDAVETADGQALETGVRVAINDFVLGCKQDEIWDAIKASCILAGARTLDGCLVPLVGVAPTRNGTEAGWNYNRETGLAGNATNNYLNSNRAANASSVINNHFALYAASMPTANFTALAGADTFYRISRGNGQVLNSQNHSSISQLNTTLFTAGFIGMSRSAQDSYVVRGNGSSITASKSQDRTSTSNVSIFASGTTQYSNARLSFYSIGESLDLAALDTRVSNLITAIGAAIP